MAFRNETPFFLLYHLEFRMLMSRFFQLLHSPRYLCNNQDIVLRFDIVCKFYMDKVSPYC